MARKSKNGVRSIHLHNPSAIKFLEEYALEYHLSLYKAMEEIIFKVMTGETVVKEVKTCTFEADNGYAYNLMKSLLQDGYIVIAEDCGNYKTKLTLKESEE